jgi:hypothetical protein
MDHREPDHEQRAGRAATQVAADLRRVPLDRVPDGVAQRRDSKRHGNADQNARHRYGDAGPSSSAGRPAVHDR